MIERQVSACALPGRCAAAAVPLGTAAALILAACSAAMGGQPEGTRLSATDFSLVEIGAYGQFSVLEFVNPVLVARKLASNSGLIGVSRGGDLLLVSRRPTSGPHPFMDDEVDITDLSGAVITSIRPAIRGMLAYFAELSPDGGAVAFVGNFARNGGRAAYGLHLLRVDGQINTLVATSESESPKGIAWSADGEEIVYDRAGHVFLYGIAAGAAKMLAAGTSPTWSPDGAWISYRLPSGAAGLISSDGSRSGELLPGTRIVRAVRWSPDGQYALFTDERTGEVRVHGLKNGRTTTVLLPTDGYDESRLRWVRGLAR